MYNSNEALLELSGEKKKNLHGNLEGKVMFCRGSLDLYFTV